MTVQLRNFVFTLNNWSFQDREELLKLDYHYLVFGKEIGDSGTPHLQGYCELKKRYRLSKIKEYIPRAHIEKRRGTPQQASDYCKKDGDFEEYGEMRRQGCRNDLVGFLEDVQGSKPTMDELLQTTLYMRYPRHCHLVIDTYYPPAELDALDNEWIWGPTGTGKSRKARDENPSLYLKGMNKWWDGFVDEDTALIEDIDSSHAFMGYYLKIWADYYPFRAEFKGGSRAIRPKRIIVTSNYHPSEIFPDRQILDPILRRFRLIGKC